MEYEEFYRQVVAVHKNNLTDPIDFANDIIGIINRFESEERRPTKRALDSATPCPDCGSEKLGIHSINCSRYRPPSK